MGAQGVLFWHNNKNPLAQGGSCKTGSRGHLSPPLPSLVSRRYRTLLPWLVHTHTHTHTCTAEKPSEPLTANAIAATQHLPCSGFATHGSGRGGGGKKKIKQKLNIIKLQTIIYIYSYILHRELLYKNKTLFFFLQRFAHLAAMRKEERV